MQLLELLEQLRLRNLETEQQLLEIRRLNSQLYTSNREINDLLEERDRKNLLLQQINEDLDAFAHTVSHDLRAPLQNIDGLTNALESCLDNENLEETQLLFPMLREQTHKMDRLITGVLAYSLAGHHNLRKQVVDVQALLQQVISSLYVPPAFRIQVQPDLPMLYTQEVYLYQIFSNLIGNAIKYHDRPQEGCIDIQFQAQPDGLRFVVQDNGPGIPQAYQQQIFQSFETVGHQLGHSYSTGLGLAIVQKIVTNKEGRVWVESEGRGTRFMFTWPADEVVPKEEN
jgi:signal transduction histidine kinase